MAVTGVIIGKAITATVLGLKVALRGDKGLILVKTEGLLEVIDSIEKGPDF